MKLRHLLAVLLLSCPFWMFAQKAKIPKNLRKAVLQLDETTPDSIKQLIKVCGNDTIRQINYPWGGDFKTVYTWTNSSETSPRLTTYLKKKGIIHYQVEVILIAFKEYLNQGYFEEAQILSPFLRREEKLRIQEENRYTADSLYSIYIPVNLADCFAQLDTLLPDSLRAELTLLSRDEFISKTHFGLGLWLRNNWQLWGGSRLSTYFRDKGIFHADDMSGIILTSYHRHLNHQDIGLAEQIASSQAYWKKREEENLIRKKEALEEDRKYLDEWQVGDTLEFMFELGFVSQEQEDIWMSDACIATGILLEKNREEVRVRVKILETCDRKGLIYEDNKDVLIFDKKSERWVPPKKRVIKTVRKGKDQWFSLEEWDTIY